MPDRVKQMTTRRTTSDHECVRSQRGAASETNILTKTSITTRPASHSRQRTHARKIVAVYGVDLEALGVLFEKLTHVRLRVALQGLEELDVECVQLLDVAEDDVHALAGVSRRDGWTKPHLK
jgi:hypothetical protein